jgi:hypothetical protein
MDEGLIGGYVDLLPGVRPKRGSALLKLFRRALVSSNPGNGSNWRLWQSLLSIKSASCVIATSARSPVLFRGIALQH